jgi:transcriptional regulator of acetoin/glycerol metabolism
VIASSWQRVSGGGLSTDHRLDDVAVEDVDRGSRLLAAARPVLDEIADCLPGTWLGILLADRTGRVVARRFGHRDVAAVFDRKGALTGRRLDERTSGTNAIATALELRDGIAVHGQEHYLRVLRGFSCFGQPIFHPVTGRLEGVVDVTGPASLSAAGLAPLARLGAKGIERRLLHGARVRERELLAAFHAANLRRDVAVVGLGEDVVLTNGAAAELLAAGDHAMLREIGLGDAATPERVGLRLISGRTVDVRVLVRLEQGAVLAVSSPEPRAVVAVERMPVNAASCASASSPTSAPTRSPSVSAAPPLPRPDLSVLGAPVVSAVPGLVAGGRSVLVSGEPGTGRTTLGHCLAGGVDERSGAATPDTAMLEVDAATLALAGPQAWLSGLRRALAAPGPLLLEQVHLLDAATASAAALLLAADDDTRRLVLTCADVATLTPEQAHLCARCTERIALTPLRYRRGELPAIVTTLAATRPGGAAARFSPRALEHLARHDWPGNLTELRAVVDHALHRPHGLAGRGTPTEEVVEIGPDDLPTWYRTTGARRPLTPLEQAEHDVVVATLAACGGNKVAAAARLGISRTTLYQRLRALRISG